MNKKEKQKKRPLSHNPLLNFSHDDNFLYSDPKFMNEELWKRKYNLRKLHQKWERKVKTNFLNIDLKFGRSKNKNNKLNQIIYRDHILINKYNIPKLAPLSPSNNKKAINTIIGDDKYNDKISYYLSHNNPWNNGVSVDKKFNLYNFKNFNRTKNELLIKNNLKNSNEAKNIIVKCKYYNNQYIHRIKMLKELINKYASDTLQEISKKYEKEIKLKRHGKQNFKNYLVFKEMVNKYKNLYKNLETNKIFLKKSNSDINLNVNLNETNEQKAEKDIYKELYLIINYLKENKDIINNQKNKEMIIKSYFEVLEKDEILRDKNIQYQKYILNFAKIDINNDIKKNDNDESNKKPNLLSCRKKNFSCLNLTKNKDKDIKKKYLEYNISFYHPGTYYLFNKGDDEYHAWSCCMNENKTSKGCCKKIEKKPIFNYDII